MSWGITSWTKVRLETIYDRNIPPNIIYTLDTIDMVKLLLENMEGDENPKYGIGYL